MLHTAIVIMRHQKTSTQIRQAAAAGRLMLGEFHEWESFSKAGSLPTGPRRLRRAQGSHDRATLGPEIESFCQKNFKGMSIQALSCLFQRIKEGPGIRMPLTDFESEFAPFRPQTTEGTPRHATVSITLWGLQFEFPEDHFGKDIRHAYTIADETSTEIRRLKSLTQQAARKREDEISKLIQNNNFAKRVIVVQSICLIECYLNGLAWDYLQKHSNLTSLSTNRRKLLEDRTANFRDKLLKYQEIIFNESIIEENSEIVIFILGVMKPFRDAMMHPSPFSHPSDFGGITKLDRIYNLSDDDARRAAKTAFEFVGRFEQKRHGKIPKWAEL